MALAEAVAATKKALDASRVVDRSLALVDGARAAIAAYKCTGATTATFHAGSLTLQDAGRGELTVELIEAKLTRAAAEEELVNAEAAHALLAVEAMKAVDEARQAEAGKIAIFADTTKATAVDMLPRPRDAAALAGRLRASIAGHMDCWALNIREAFKPVPIEVSLRLKGAHDAPVMVPETLDWQQAVARWQEYRIELASDPEAKATVALGQVDDADVIVAVKPLLDDLVRSF